MDKLVKVRRPCQSATFHQLVHELPPALSLHHLLLQHCPCRKGTCTSTRPAEQVMWAEQGWQTLQELDAYGADTFAPGDLLKLPYLEACLKEAMRLYPPGVFLIREPLTEDFHLQGYTIPKGTWIHVSLLPRLLGILLWCFPKALTSMRSCLQRACNVASLIAECCWQHTSHFMRSPFLLQCLPALLSP